MGYKSATVEEFIDRHALDVGWSGIYLKTEYPLPIGTLLKFEVQLAGGQVALAGIGRVVWTRAGARANAVQPPGMGVKFIEMDEPSTKLLDELVSARPEAGLAFEAGEETIAGEGDVPARAADRRRSEAAAAAGDALRKATLMGIGPSLPPLAPSPKPAHFPASPSPGGAMFPPPSGEAAPPVDEPTVMTRMEDVLHEFSEEDNTLALQLDGPTLIRRVPDRLEEAVREANSVPPSEPPTSRDAVEAIVLASALPGKPVLGVGASRERSRALALTLDVVAVAAACALVLMAYGHRLLRGDAGAMSRVNAPSTSSTHAAEAASSFLVIATSAPSQGESLPSVPSAAPGATEGVRLDVSPMATTAARPEAGSPAKAHTVPPKPARPPTTGGVLSKPRWLLKPSNVDNPY